MTQADFEALYRTQADPWSYTTSEYERRKYAATLEACIEGSGGRVASALELGSSIGVFSDQLAPFCRSLITVDASPTALASARARLSGRPWVTPVLGAIPDAIPLRRFDLVVASEILYYLEPEALSATLVRLRRCLATGGRLVAVHWRPAGPERPFTADEVHARLRGESWLTLIASHPTDDYLLDVHARMR